jgi:hypothetical protein
MSDTDLFENEILKLKLGKAPTLTYPITPYLALFTTLPAEDGTGGVEVSTSGTGYARQAINAKFPTPSGTGTVANSAIVDFGTASANWGSIVGFGIYTAVSGGSLITIGDINPAVTVSSGQPVTFPIGALQLIQS